MKKMLLCLSLTLTATLSSAFSAGLAPFDVATSPKGSTASTMFSDLGKVCLTAAPLRQRQTSGSDENLELLLGNQVAMAFVQLDVLKARQQIDHDPRVDAVKTLLPLNFDEIHVIAPRPVTQRNMLGRTSVKGATTFSGLAGKTVGAWGGSVVTAQVLASRGKVKYSVRTFKGRDEAMQALASGQIQAVVAVTGQPADWVKALDPQRFTLLPIDIAPEAIGGFYRPEVLQYTGLGQGVKTYGVQRLLVTRDFKTPEKRAALLAYQRCAQSKLSALQETQGFHPKWNDVTFQEQNWPLFK